MKVFLSLPMSGRTDEEIWDDIFEMNKYVLENKEAFGIKEDEKWDVTHNMLTEPELDLFDLIDDVKHKNLLYLGAAIIKLAQCDAVLFSNGWNNARGCVIEHEVCMQYGIPTFYISENKVLSQEKLSEQAEKFLGSLYNDIFAKGESK